MSPAGKAEELPKLDLGNASVQQPLSMNRCPLLCHLERSRGMCTSAELMWNRRIRHSKWRIRGLVGLRWRARVPANLLLVRTRAGEMTTLFKHLNPHYHERYADLQIPRLRSG